MFLFCMATSFVQCLQTTQTYSYNTQNSCTAKGLSYVIINRICYTVTSQMVVINKNVVMVKNHLPLNQELLPQLLHIRYLPVNINRSTLNSTLTKYMHKELNSTKVAHHKSSLIMKPPLRSSNITTYSCLR